VSAPVAALEVVAAVIVDGGEVLACRRAPHTSSAGLWEFPGGKVEAGEAPRDALVREIREELGVDVAIDGELTTDTTAVGGRLIRLACYRARLLAPRPSASTDHDRLLWVSTAELGRLEWAAPDLPAVRLLTLE
jgi:8-oxo-dGTP diphosphatase